MNVAVAANGKVFNNQIDHKSSILKYWVRQKFLQISITQIINTGIYS